MGLMEWFGLSSNRSRLNQYFMQFNEYINKHDKKSAQIVLNDIEQAVEMELVALARNYDKMIKSELSRLRSDFKNVGMTDVQILAHADQVKQKIKQNLDFFSAEAQTVLQNR